MLEIILENYPEDDFLKADGFDDAVIGVDELNMKLIYSVSKCVAILMKNMSYEEALEYFDFNVAGSYMGEKTPIWCYDIF
jgi:hypothetical protein